MCLLKDFHVVFLAVKNVQVSFPEKLIGSVENSTAVSLLLVAHLYRKILSRYRHETSLLHYCCCWMRDLQGGGGRLFYRANSAQGLNIRLFQAGIEVLS